MSEPMVALVMLAVEVEMKEVFTPDTTAAAAWQRPATI